MQYTTSDSLRLFIRQLMALAFLPEWEISSHYSELQQRKPSGLPQLDDLLDYFENGVVPFRLQCNSPTRHFA